MADVGIVGWANRAALALAAALFVALGAWWWRERTRAYEAPRWPDPSFVALVAPGPGAPSQRWIVAVNPDCARCTERLADLRRRREAWTVDMALGALLVDVPRRPDSLAGGAGLDAGVWWDSLGVWRARWGHRAYGETMVFGPGGALARVIAPAADVMPGAP